MTKLDEILKQAENVFRNARLRGALAEPTLDTLHLLRTAEDGLELVRGLQGKPR